MTNVVRWPRWPAGSASVAGLVLLALGWIAAPAHAQLLGISPGYPTTTFGNGTVTYNGATGQVTVVAVPLQTQFRIGGPQNAIATPKSLSIAFFVNYFGHPVAGMPGPDLELVGTVVDGAKTYTGTLLTGEIDQMGFEDSGGTLDLLDMRFTVTGGTMASLFNGTDIGLVLTMENSSFVGNFDLSFGALARGGIGPIAYKKRCFDPLGDYVWEDKNGNGLQDPGEPGLNGIRVRLMGPGAVPIETTITKKGGPQNKDGFYEFNYVCAGCFIIEVFDVDIPQGCVPTPSNVGPDRTIDSNGSPDGLCVANDYDSDETIDFGYVCACVAEIGDRVWVDTNKNGVQDVGEAGKDNVIVELLDGAGQPFNPARITTTAGGGLYKFTNLCAGTYRVKFTRPTSFDFTLPDNGDDLLDSDADPATGTTPVITLTNGQKDYSWDAGVIPIEVQCFGSIGDFVWNDLNFNGIQDPNEPGIDGATVILRDGIGNQIDITTTSNGGKYLFSTRCKGSYQVEVLRPAGFDFASPPFAAGPDPNQTVPNDSNGVATIDNAKSVALVALLANNTTNLTIDFGFFKTPPCTGRIGDFVWNDLNKNGLQDANEPGIPGVKLTLINSINQVLTSTVTDGAGLYSFTALCKGTYTVEVDPTTLPAGATWFPALEGMGDVCKDTDGGSDNRGTTVLTADTSVDLCLDFGFYAQLGRLGDRVWLDTNRDALQNNGEPGLNGWTVNLYKADGTFLASTVTAAGTCSPPAPQNGSGGCYKFDNLTAGNYKVCVVRKVAAYNPTYDLDGVATPDCALASLTSGQKRTDVDFGYAYYTLLDPGGRVWNDVNGNGAMDAGEPGLAGVLMTLYGPYGSTEGTQLTGADGSYGFVPEIEGMFTVCVTPPAGFVQTYDYDGIGTPDCASLYVHAGELKNDVHFGYRNPNGGGGGTPPPSGAAIGGKIWNDADIDGVPSSFEAGLPWSVSLSGAGSAAVTADASGNYTFGDLTAGTFTVCVTPASGYIPTFDADGTGSVNCATMTLAAGQQRMDVNFGYRRSNR